MTAAGTGVVNWLRRAVGPRGRPVARWMVDAFLASRLGSVKCVRTPAMYVAVTFDDGPDPTWTPRVLDVLGARDAQSTFFVLVGKARKHPELVHRVVAEGHEVGLHGADHRSLVGMSRAAVRRLLQPARAELEEIAGTRVTLFRPPFGAQGLGSFLGARDAGLDCVVWGPYGMDWLDLDEGEVAERILWVAAPGDIVLLHDGLERPKTETGPPPAIDRAKVAALVLDGLLARGLRSTTLSALRASGETCRTVWFRR